MCSWEGRKADQEPHLSDKLLSKASVPHGHAPVSDEPCATAWDFDRTEGKAELEEVQGEEVSRTLRSRTLDMPCIVSKLM